MTTVASRDLRNHTSEVLRRVANGATVTVTVNGRPVAELRPARSQRRLSISWAELQSQLPARPKAADLDETIDSDLAWISDGTTDDLGPIR